MEINTKNYNLNKNLNFKSGITKKEIAVLKNIPMQFINDTFVKSSTEVDLRDNQTIGILNLLCKNLLSLFRETKTFSNIDFSLVPNSIKVFNTNETVRNFPDSFCSVSSNKILKNQISAPNCLFYKNKQYSIEEMNNMAEFAKKVGYISNDNFLTYIMHEWMHSLHLNYLYTTLGKNENEVLKIMHNLKNFNFSSVEKEMIEEILGKYVYNEGKINGGEVLAEGLNKIICSCMNDKKLAIIQDIDKSAEKLPTEFIGLLHKILYQID